MTQKKSSEKMIRKIELVISLKSLGMYSCRKILDAAKMPTVQYRIVRLTMYFDVMYLGRLIA